jgi:hypothetical protein
VLHVDVEDALERPGQAQQLGFSRPALYQYPLVAESGFTTVQVRCRLTARGLAFNRATKMRAEGLGLLASISIPAP